MHKTEVPVEEKAEEEDELWQRGDVINTVKTEPIVTV